MKFWFGPALSCVYINDFLVLTMTLSNIVFSTSMILAIQIAMHRSHLLVNSLLSFRHNNLFKILAFIVISSQLQIGDKNLRSLPSCENSSKKISSFDSPPALKVLPYSQHYLSLYSQKPGTVAQEISAWNFARICLIQIDAFHKRITIVIVKQSPKKLLLVQLRW